MSGIEIAGIVLAVLPLLVGEALPSSSEVASIGVNNMDPDFSGGALPGRIRAFDGMEEIPHRVSRI
jgi:hypothetical protein